MTNAILEQIYSAVFSRLGVRISNTIDEVDFLSNKNVQAHLDKFPSRDTVEIADGVITVWMSDTPIGGVYYIQVHYAGEFQFFAGAHDVTHEAAMLAAW